MKVYDFLSNYEGGSNSIICIAKYTDKSPVVIHYNEWKRKLPLPFRSAEITGWSVKVSDNEETTLTIRTL